MDGPFRYVFHKKALIQIYAFFSDPEHACDFLEAYNTPQKLDRRIRCMLACSIREGEKKWSKACEETTMGHLKPGLPSKP
jgi:hypothetical protein